MEGRERMCKIGSLPVRSGELECMSSNYSETTGSLWFYSKDGATNLLGNTEANNANGILKNTTNAVPLKYLSNFWRSLEMSLINCKVVLSLK